MRPYSSISLDMKIKKRKKKPISEKTSPSPLHKSNINIELLNSMRLLKKNIKQSHIALTKKSGFIDSLNNTNSLKLLTPKNKYQIENEKKKPEKNDSKTLYTSIIAKIENIMVNYKEDINKLCNILIKIESYINSIAIINETGRKNEAKKDDNNRFLTLKGQNFKDNLESIDEIQNNKMLSPINDSNANKINLSNNNLFESDHYEFENHIYKRKINKLMLKINEMENKFKIEQLSYLFYIGEYQKKVAELEKKLNINSIGKMPRANLKKLLCYPNYIKFDINDDINPKSIPMYNQKNKRCHCSINNLRKNKQNSLSKSKSDTLFISFDNDLTKIKDNKDHLNSCIDSSCDIKNIINNNNEEEKEREKEKEVTFNDISNIKIDSQLLSLDKIFGKNKNFFLSHPKLNYIKSLKDGNKITSWKLENQINSLPKEISKLTSLPTKKKNPLVFPSFLGETLLNLEKLRTNKNFRSIENKFEEECRMKTKNEF